MNLSDHFTLKEFTASQTADRCFKFLCLSLEIIRLHFKKPIRITSGFRSIELNRKIGSSDRSQHIKGEAADFEIPGVSNLEVFKWCVDNLDYDQIILEFYNKEDPNSGWVHLSSVRGNNRKKAMIAYKTSKGVVYENYKS